jgi:endogenous inhibitor of DNA gyrase (YacG/DUF329 family)
VAKIKVTCVHCGKEIERYPSQVLNTVYCSRKCRSDYHRKYHTIVFKCDFCGKDKRVRKANFNYDGMNFCTRKCKDTWQREGLKEENNPFYGLSHSEATKKKVSETKKAQDLTGEKAHNYNTHPVKCDECGKIVYKIQYLIDRNENQFCSIECHGAWRSKHQVGENSPTWNPNLTDVEREQGRKYPEYYEFLTARMEFDEYTCQICGKYSKWGNGLNVHHLNSYDWNRANRTNIENGITLCRDCHTEFHKTYGYGKNTKTQFKEFLESVS